mgnify:FL=1
MKTKILTLLTASLLAPTIAAAEGGLSGDTKLACEAILCLSSGTRPGECTPSLNRYFSISHKYLSDTIRGRLNFLNLCPANNPGMAELKRAIANGAGRCDARELNRVMKRTITVRECHKTPGTMMCNKEREVCEDVQRRVILNQKPSYCNDYHGNEMSRSGDTVRYQGDPKQGGKWVDVKQ